MDNRTIVFPESERVTFRNQQKPTAGPAEIGIETERSLISTGTELTILSGDFPAGSNWADYSEYPFEPGYCNVGRVIETGSVVDDAWMDRLVVSRSPHTRYATLNPERDPCAPVPDDVSLEEASFFALAGIAMNGLRRSRLAWGEDVAIFGLGLVGQLAARLCRIAGARSVTGFDVEEARLDYFTDDSVLRGYDPRAIALEDAVTNRTGDGEVDVIFEVTGRPDAIPNQFDVLGPRGRFVVLSSPRGPTKLDLHDRCNAPSYEIIGAHELSHAPLNQEGWTHEPLRWNLTHHYDLFFEYLRTGRLDVESLISHRIPVEDAEAVYHRLLKNRSDALGVVLEW